MQLNLRQSQHETNLAEQIMSEPHKQQMFDDVILPLSILHDSNVSIDIECHEELSELNWMQPILEGADVLHIGCNFGLWSARISQMSRRVVGYDGNHERAQIARDVFAVNERSNATAVAELDADDLSLGNVIVVDFRRPIADHLYRRITDGRPTATIIVTGRCTAEVASRLLRAGYEHCADYPRASVFQRRDSH